MDTDPTRIRRIHLGLVLAEAICIPAFIFEISRALSGNTLSWAYVFEWPLFGGYAIFMWRRLLADERGEVRPTRPRAQPSPDDDEALEKWNEYLRQVHGPDAAAGTNSPQAD